MNVSIYVPMSLCIYVALGLCISYVSVRVTFRRSKRSTFWRSKRSAFRCSKRTPDRAVAGVAELPNMNLHKSIKVSFQKGQAFEAGAAPGGLPFVQGCGFSESFDLRTLINLY